MEKKYILSKNQEGQAAIEFLLTLIFGLGITFLFVNLTINYTIGYVAHYATFMSSRVFLTYDTGGQNADAVLNTAENRAKEKFDGYDLQRFGVSSEKLMVYRPGPAGNAANAMFVGVTIEFNKLMSTMASVGGRASLTMLSESFLGKEPTRKECYDRVCAALGQQSCNSRMLITLFDNGC